MEVKIIIPNLSSAYTWLKGFEKINTKQNALDLNKLIIK